MKEIEEGRREILPETAAVYYVENKMVNIPLGVPIGEIFVASFLVKLTYIFL